MRVSLWIFCLALAACGRPSKPTHDAATPGSEPAPAPGSTPVPVPAPVPGPTGPGPAWSLTDAFGAKTEIFHRDAASRSSVGSFAAFANGTILASVSHWDDDYGVELRRIGAGVPDGEAPVWDLAADGAVLFGFSNVLENTVLVTYVDKGCEWHCIGHIKRYDATTGVLEPFADLPGGENGLLQVDYPTIRLHQTVSAVYALLKSTAFTTELIVFEHSGAIRRTTTIVPSLEGYGGIFALDSLLWSTADGIYVTLSDLIEWSDPPPERRVVDAYAAATGVPLTGAPIGSENIVIVRLDADGVVRENRVVYGGDLFLSPAGVAATSTETVLIANEWGSGTARPFLVTVAKDAASIQPFPLGERENTFDAITRLPSGDLLVSAGIGFDQAPTGSITAADDAIVLLLRAQDGVWTEAERTVVSATPLRDSVVDLKVVGSAVYLLGYFNGPMTHDTEIKVETGIWRL